MKKGNILILTILGIAAAAGTWYLVRRTNSQTDDGTGGTTGGNTSGGGSTTGTVGGGVSIPVGNVSTPANLNYSVVLKQGMGWISYGAEVKALQLILNNVQTSSPLVVDGLFGPKTAAKLSALNGGMAEITLAQAKIKWPWA